VPQLSSLLAWPAERRNNARMRARIGEQVVAGDVLGRVDHSPVPAPLSGVLRGLIHDGVRVEQGLKIGDIDPRGQASYCFTISEKSLAVGGGVLEAILVHLNKSKG